MQERRDSTTAPTLCNEKALQFECQIVFILYFHSLHELTCSTPYNQLRVSILIELLRLPFTTTDDWPLRNPLRTGEYGFCLLPIQIGDWERLEEERKIELHRTDRKKIKQSQNGLSDCFSLCVFMCFALIFYSFLLPFFNLL